MKEKLYSKSKLKIINQMVWTHFFGRFLCFSDKPLNRSGEYVFSHRILWLIDYSLIENIGKYYWNKWKQINLYKNVWKF